MPLQDHEQELLEALRVGELDSLMEQGRGLTLSEIALPLRDYLESITAILPRAIDRALMTCGDRAVTAFGCEYFQRHRTELSGFSERARGSERIARFQRFGAYDRLKAFYVQRFGLRRKLAASLAASQAK